MGGQRAIAFLYHYMGKDADIEIVGTNNNGEATGYHFKVLPVLGNSVARYANPFLYFRLKKAMKQAGSQHLILVHPYYAWLGWMMKYFDGKHLTIQTQNIESERFKSFHKWWWPILWQYEKLAHKSADQNFFITEEDRQYGLKNFGLSVDKSHTITYGFEMQKGPEMHDLNNAREVLRKMHRIGNDTILFFNGSLDYAPNIKALDYITEFIIPGLRERNFAFKLMICGKGLPERFNGFKEWPEVIYAGFVDDIGLYFKGADIFINPVIEGGGIKTKLVEALGYNLTSVSTENGAYGIPREVIGSKLLRSADHNWVDFCSHILNASKESQTPKAFYDYFYWGNIAHKALDILKEPK